MSPASPIDCIFTKHLIKGVLELVLKVLGMEVCGKGADLSLSWGEPVCASEMHGYICHDPTIRTPSEVAETH